MAKPPVNLEESTSNWPSHTEAPPAPAPSAAPSGTRIRLSFHISDEDYERLLSYAKNNRGKSRGKSRMTHQDIVELALREFLDRAN